MFILEEVYMLRKNVAGDLPQIDTTAFIDPSAVIIGRVKIGGNTYIGPGVVIRADRFSTVDEITRIEIGANCCVQDTAVLHARAETFIIIRDDTSISHGAIIHGPTTIGKRCFVGARSNITHSMIGDSVYIRINAVIENAALPNETFVPNSEVIEGQEMTIPLRKITAKEKEFLEKCIQENREFALKHKYSLTD
jgi:carbonic anhydrase/acetyltransferase-like protein (isoleucine patch superfamily)